VATAPEAKEDDMVDSSGGDREGISLEVGFKELEIVAFLGEFRIVGLAHFGVGHRSSSRRASDYIRSFQDNRLTLSDVRIYSKGSQEPLETAPFIILNLEKVDFLYARDDEAEPPAP
jgi:hypothetical protein